MQRYFGIRKDEKYLYLHDTDYHHIKNVMRMSNGDLVEVVVDDNVYIGCIENVKSDIRILIKNEIEKVKEFIPFVNIIIPPLKENKMDFILQKSAEMGVSKITICPLKRCVVRVEDKKKKTKLERWKKILKEASEQSKRYKIPDIEFVEGIKDLENLGGLKIVCSTTELKNNVKKVLTKNKKCDTINLVIGPEGGLDKDEEEKLVEYGFVKTTFGSRIMRVETVPLFVLSIINYEFME